ncbi:MAG: sensor histidine kinase [Pirellulaceae bacterium]
MSSKNSQSGDAADLRRQAEKIVREKAAQSTENLEVLSREKTRQTIHELQVHQIELEMQNEELRRAQVELEASRARYIDLYDFAPVGYVTVSEVGLILEANLTAATLLAVPRGALVRQPLTRFVLFEDQDIYYRHHKRLFETGTPQLCELRLLRTDSPPFWAQLEASGTQDGEDGLPDCRIVMSDISDRALAEDRIKASLAVKEVLLKEIHHRVKNNMQVMSSLVSLQAERVSDAAMREVLQDVIHRVRSMALVHETLYGSADLDRVEFAEYARRLLTYLWRAHTATASGIRLVLDLEPICISINAAVPCGLILNELVSNALKHAFRGRTGGEVAVSLRGTPEGRVCLRVRDNGVGLPAGFDWRQADSLGLCLIHLLAGQLHATAEVTCDEGTEFAVVFDEAKPFALLPLAI